MHAKSLLGTLTVVAVVGATITGGASAGAAPSYLFVGYAGGSLVRAFDSTITSDLTAASSISGGRAGLSDTDSTVRVTVPSLIDTGAVNTSSLSKAIDGGYAVVSNARIADVSLLGGLIKIDAVDTTSTTKVVDGTASTNTSTTFVGLKIANVKLPVRIPHNFAVTIPGVATVALDYGVGQASDGQAVTFGAGVVVTLLHAQGDSGSGATVFLNPVYAAIGLLSPSEHVVAGLAYGSKVTADVGTLLHVRSDPTAPVQFIGVDTGGKTLRSSTAAVNLATALHVGAISDTGTGTSTATHQEAETTSEIAGVNLLNGLITADAITSQARVEGPLGGPYLVTGSSNLVHLTIAGKAIAIGARPNTVISIGSIARITINQQFATPNGITVRALDVTLLQGTHDLPVGAEIQVASTTAAAR